MTEKKILPHGAWQQLAENLWHIEGKLQLSGGIPFTRCMVVIRLSDERLLIHNGVALQPAQMTELESWGEPAFLIVPSRFHRMDAAWYTARYPQLQVLCPSGARTEVETKVRVAGSYADWALLAGKTPEIELQHVAGCGDIEGVVVVKSVDGETLICNDLLFNLPHRLPGLLGWLFQLTGLMAAGLRLSRLIKWGMLKDALALKQQFLDWSQRPIKRLIVAHGDVFTQDVSKALQQLAQELK